MGQAEPGGGVDIAGVVSSVSVMFSALSFLSEGENREMLSFVEIFMLCSLCGNDIINIIAQRWFA